MDDPASMLGRKRHANLRFPGTCSMESDKISGRKSPPFKISGRKSPPFKISGRKSPPLPGPAGSGDFSHGLQHVFWTCSHQTIKSRHSVLQKTSDFLDRLK